MPFPQPWHLTYQCDKAGSVHEERVSQHEPQLRLSEPGFYDLLQVGDFFPICETWISSGNTRSASCFLPCT
jgi:hypothetical protein